MRIKTILTAAAVTLLAAVSCEQEVMDVNDRLDNLESRVSKLEQLVSEMNDNISSLQSIVTAMQMGDYITSVMPITASGATVGYTITFAKGDPITIYHGEDGTDGKDGKDGTNGQDGHTPVIGVKQDTDGIWYWTLDGQWLLDANGQKVKAVGVDGKDGADGKDGTDGKDGQDGKDGITPQLKIEGGYWFVSTDNGQTWTQLGKATGEDGKDGVDGKDGKDGAIGLTGDSMFTSIDTSNSDYVVFMLMDGTVLTIPTWYAFEQLKTLCTQMNSNIEALQTIVSALQNANFISSVLPLVENGVQIGYYITFCNGESINIYHGKDGANGKDGQDGTDGKDGADGKDGTNGQDGKDGTDGHTPVIGVMQDTDGIWYWTVDGEWLLDANGQKVKAIGTDGKDGANGQNGQDGQDGQDGKDGITPQLKIESGYWFVSTDNGQTWTQLGKATGEDGKDGIDGIDGKDGKDGDSMFQSVTVTETEVTFVISDGQTFVVRRAAALSIEFDSADLVVMGTNTTRNIHYTITSGADDITIEALSSADIKVKVVKTDAKTGTLQVRTGATIDEYSKVVVLVNNGSQAIMRTLNFEAEAIEVEENTTKEVTDEGGEVTLEFFSNVPCHAVIPVEAQSWISVVPETKAITKQYITLLIKQNDGESRSTVVALRNENSTISIAYNIKQCASLSLLKEKEKAALVSLYESGEGYHWPDYWEFWNTTASVSSYRGIVVNERGLVKSLTMYPYHGEIPDIFSSFTELESLTIYGEFRGQMPESITGLSQLKHLEIRHSGDDIASEEGLSGDIDLDWSRLTNLEYLEITGQSITGPIPNSISQLKNLRQLILNGNLLSGEIPSGFGSLSNLNQLNLSSNNLTGTIPETLGELSNLEELSLAGNLMEGELPLSLLKLTSLKSLNISGYEYDDERAKTNHRNNFYGDFSFLAEINSLESLLMSHNGFSGAIPDAIWGMPNLKRLDLKGNAFEGCLSPAIGDSRSLESIRLGNNCLSGELPDELWTISTLKSIDLTNSYTVGMNTLSNFNHFSGGISNSISLLTNLVSFRILNNDFSGPIPETVVELKSLIEFVLCNNNFTGTIPDGMKTMDCLSVFWCNNNKLSGSLSADLSAAIQQKGWVVSPQKEGYGLVLDYYSSVDYTQHETIKVLQTASVGKGIDIILVGDAYTDQDIASGEYDRAITLMFEALFEKEPFRSFRNCFNVYEIVLVSKNGTGYGETALDIKDGSPWSYYDFNPTDIRDYVHSIIPITNYDDATISVVTKINNSSIGLSSLASNVNIVSASYDMDEDYFKQVFQHETIGHGFGKLADEYYSDSDGSITDEEKSFIQLYHEKGYYLNIDITDNPNEVIWKHFLSIPDYNTELLGMYEGGWMHKFGVWRPTQKSIMSGTPSSFNAPSREVIYKKIHLLAYGDEWVYDFNDFLEWDRNHKDFILLEE